MVKIQEAENQIITSYEVYESKPSDSDLLVKAVEQHCKRLGQIPDLVAADAAFHSPSQKAAGRANGRDAHFGSEPADEESCYSKNSEDAVVSERPEVANRL